MMALKACGVSKVYVVDIMEKRLEKALELGADGVINGRGAGKDMGSNSLQVHFTLLYRIDCHRIDMAVTGEDG